MATRVLILVFALLPGCQSTAPKFESCKPESVRIADAEFTRIRAKDTFGSAWRMIELRPLNLPYGGEFAALSAQERWEQILKVLLASVKEECQGKAPGQRKIGADQEDYASFGNSPQYPKFAQAKFICRK